MEQDVVLGGSLVNMYVKCGSLEDARQLFNKLRVRNVVTWTAMIAGYAQKELGHEALLLYRSMQQEGLISPNSVTYLCLLQACASVGVGSLSEGKELHAQIRRRGLQEEVALSSSLINMYVKCGSLEDARTFFDNLPERTVVTWNAMLAGYTQQGMGMGALSLYSGMQQEGLITPNSVTYICLLQACAIVGQGALHEGIQLHALVKEQQLQEDVVVAGSLVNMYAKCGSLEDSQRLFDRLPEKNVVTWNAMIAGYAQQGMGQKALSLYRRMQQEDHVPPNSITFACLLQACASVGVDALHEGKWLHVQIKEQGLEDGPLGSSLVNMYAKCGSVETAQRLFDRLPERTVVAWTAMLAGYTQLGMGQEALVLYSRMEQEGLSPPDCVTYVCLLQACAHVGVAALHHGKQLHAQIKERGLQEDVVLGGSLVNMYAKCGNLEDARQVFDSLPERNVQTWNAMLGGYAQQDMGQEALGLYSRMQEEGITPPNLITYVCLLQACANVGAEALHEGRHLHAQIKERGLQEDGVLAGSLINMYAKSGSLEDARQLFDKLSVKNAVTWTAMIAGYAQKELGEEALSLYTRMLDEGLILGDSIMYVCLLQACAVVAALPLGKQLHAEIDERGMQGDVVVVTALVNMYAKCGSMRDSQLLFDSLIEKSVEAWGALIDGYARQGNSEVVFSLFDGMTQEGIEPDAITFLSVLTVCSHSGLVDKGRKYFEAMRTDYGINATSDHLTCMMDLFGRAGYLDEALQMAKSMPSSSTGVVWLALLAACQKWNDIEIGQQVFDLAVKFDENEAAAYVMMSNIYARAEMWEEAKEMYARRLRLGAWKEPGRSWWTDMDGMVHSFVAGNRRAESEYYLCKAGTGNSLSRVVQEEGSLTTRRNSSRRNPSLSARPGNGNRSTD